MDKDSITFSVQMTAREVYRFTFYHVYHSFSGLFGLCLSLLALVNLIANFSELSDMGKTIMIIVGAWFTVLEPLMMLTRSKAQVKRTKAYRNPLNYCMNAEGITVSQEDASQTIAWEQLLKIVETNSQFLVYSSRIHSFIFPKSMLEGQEEELRALILSYSQSANVQLKGKLRKYQRKMNDKVEPSLDDKQ